MSALDRTRSNGLKLEQRKFRLCIRKRFSTINHGTGLSRDSVELSLLKVFENRLGRQLSKLNKVEVILSWEKIINSWSSLQNLFSLMLEHLIRHMNRSMISLKKKPNQWPNSVKNGHPRLLTNRLYWNWFTTMLWNEWCINSFSLSSWWTNRMIQKIPKCQPFLPSL